MTIPCLELCGAYLLTDLIHHVKEVIEIPTCDMFCWTDSTVVLNWLEGSPHHFKPFVGNRVSHIIDRIAPDHWSHVPGAENPADCASRGLLPSQLIQHDLWWNGPDWLSLDPVSWTRQRGQGSDTSCGEDELCLLTVAPLLDPIIAVDRYSNSSSLTRITAWVQRFINNCQASRRSEQLLLKPLTVDEINQARFYWISRVQQEHFVADISALKANRQEPKSSPLKSLNPTHTDYMMQSIP